MNKNIAMMALTVLFSSSSYCFDETCVNKFVKQSGFNYRVLNLGDKVTIKQPINTIFGENTANINSRNVFNNYIFSLSNLLNCESPEHASLTIEYSVEDKKVPKYVFALHQKQLRTIIESLSYHDIDVPLVTMENPKRLALASFNKDLFDDLGPELVISFEQRKVLK